ncbi:hypothetical protein DPMN_114299 [Dreissena polymorpha]|uniref:Uncharacterized protein n=1 Tax=Dreissena polymorpha TaxID=45954 RepID=A0A9D4QSB7_DREPO|nr:hypothetical protein DPMN_114299 [Dreissena polymorpha]
MNLLPTNQQNPLPTNQQKPLPTNQQTMQYKKLHDKLYEIWDRYENEDEYTTSRLLRESSHLVGSGPIPANIEDHGEDEDEE